jgi:hypothetical protein
VAGSKNPTARSAKAQPGGAHGKYRELLVHNNLLEYWEVFLCLVPGYAQIFTTWKEVIAWTLTEIHYLLVRSGRKRCFLAWKVRRMHASLQPVSGIEMSRTPPSANEAGGVFIICAGICLKFNTNRNLKT